MRKRTTQIKYALCMLLILILAMLAGCKNSAATGVTSGDSSASVEAVSGADSSKAAGAESAVDSKSESKIDAQADSSAALAAESSVSEAPDASAAESAADESDKDQSEDTQEDESPYTLRQVVVLSRHNIRSPMSGEGSILGSGTPHEWFKWTSATSQLSLKGGILETNMGQYFRKWLENEGLIPENYQPENGEVRFYANAKQRTQATARYFATGMLPVADIDVERQGEFDTMDEVFTPKIHFLNERFEEEAMKQIAEKGGEAGMKGLDADLEDSYELLTEVLDLKDSDAYKSGELTGFTTGDTEVKLEVDAEPSMTGSLKTATSFSDALVLQYYEEPDALKAAFGHELTWEEWLKIAEIKDIYQDVLFTSPLVAVNVAQPLLQEIKGELTSDEHLFTFLCGHDSNIGSVLPAMGVKEYSLPDTLERVTPIGGKLVFEVYEDADGKQFCKISLMYQTTEQIRNMEQLSLENPPAKYELEFEGIEANADGYYALTDIINRIQDALDLYDEYAVDEALAPAA